MFRIVVICDNPECSDGVGQMGWTDPEPWRFVDEASGLAEAAALGWRQWPDGRLLCDYCSLREDCAQRGGHTYRPAGVGEWRTCGHCRFTTPPQSAAKVRT